MSPTPQRAVLSNGVTVVLTANPSSDIVAGRLFIRPGTVGDPVGRSGLSNLMAALLTKGTHQRSAQNIAQQVESLGAGLGTEAHLDHVEVSWKTVTADFPVLLQLVAEIVRQPSFPPAQIELERKVILQNIRAQAERPLSLALQMLRANIYGAHPYGRLWLGSGAEVAAIEPADLLAHHHTYYRPDRTVISIAGRIEPAEVLAQLEAAWGDWQPAITDSPATTWPALQAPATKQFLSRSGQQAIVMVGHPAVAAQDPDYFPLRLIDTYLGSGLSSRLFVELREKRGLAYEVSSLFATRAERAVFAVYLGTSPENITVAIDGLRGELARLCLTRLTAEELNISQRKLLGKYTLNKQTNAQLAYLYGWYEALGLGWEFDRQLSQRIEAITTSQIEAVANRYFGEDPFLTVVGAVDPF
jgi:zinc protease